MIPVHRGRERACLQLIHSAGRLERLARDLRAIAADEGPSNSDIENARVIDDWGYGQRAIPVLEGMVRDQPYLPRLGLHTKDLWAVDAHQRWARTLDGWLVLGRARNANLIGVTARD